MSTRAIYSFRDSLGTFHVYKHHDGYPSGAAGAITKALVHAWPLPRFEADEFAASFVTATKASCGGVRLMHSGAWQEVAPGDIVYRYEIYKHDKDETLTVAAFEVRQDYRSGAWAEKNLFTGSLAKFADWAARVAA